MASLAAWSWRKWPDILVDYGMQLYIPWQLTSGKVLYRDIAYLTGGPLSQYFHALLFKLFGVSFTVLIITNLCLLAAFVMLLYRLFARAADQWTGLLVCLVMLFVFSFSQYNPGNYNYICPYSHEALHGLVLSAVAIACLRRWIATGRNAWAFTAGLCAGCVFLTKPEIFMALAAALATAWLVRRLKQAGDCASTCQAYGFLFLGLAIPVGAFVVYFTIVWQSLEGVKAVLGSWLPLLTSPVTKNGFYQWCMGLDRPVTNLVLIGKYSAGFILIVAFLALCARCFQRQKLVAIGLGALLLVLVYLAHERFDWISCGYALGPATLLCCGVVGWRWWRLRRSARGEALVFPLLWGVFALFLLTKMGLYTRIWHYGFYLAMPAVAFLVYFLFWMLPCQLERFEINTSMFRLLIVAFVMIGMLQLEEMSDRIYRYKYLPVGVGGDRIMTAGPDRSTRGAGIRLAAEWIQQKTSSSNTVAVLPEGATLNYLTRRANPTPYLLFTLSEVQVYGETNMLEAYVQNSPDFIVLIHRESSEWKVNYFGKGPGYGYDLMCWVRTNYTPVWLFGHEPLQTNKFGIKILKRNGL